MRGSGIGRAFGSMNSSFCTVCTVVVGLPPILASASCSGRFLDRYLTEKVASTGFHLHRANLHLSSNIRSWFGIEESANGRSHVGALRFPKVKGWSRVEVVELLSGIWNLLLCCRSGGGCFG